ncbi:hypothetical protein [Roseinatronobacter monicus]|uniref:Uncharacterized protein n=1 Tax=Roseinatronobacter monicus TaxID=393481 RepID=A0A543K5K0_9RHOB|nr:hypothetical protein [Roseinatronobacter monicus]TQM90345.1 hypothetical protein BD293_3722 [Roseinatronobacter monicus]
MKAWSLRTRLARTLGFDIPRLNARLTSAGQESARMAARIEALELENARLRAAPAPVSAPLSPAVPTATRLRDLLSALLDTYESTRGISCDAYCDTPQWHAMAEAQYLEAVVIAHQAGLLSDAQARLRAKASVARLQSGALHRETGVSAQWGLGFRWQDFPSDEPFLVTTALVTRALAAADGLIPCAGLVQEGFRGLARLPRREVVINDKAVALPVYAPALPEVVENTIALWAQVVLDNPELSESGSATLREAEQALEWLNGSFMPGLGWTYSKTRPVFDLMHQVYILEGLLCCRSINDPEQLAIETFASFRSGVGYIDSMTLSDRAKAIESVGRSGKNYIVFRGDRVLTARADPARVWSLGGMLGSFGLFAVEGKQPDYWLSQIRRFPVQMLPEHFGADFRQEMHLARGAALALKALRRKASDTGLSVE